MSGSTQALAAGSIAAVASVLAVQGATPLADETTQDAHGAIHSEPGLQREEVWFRGSMGAAALGLLTLGASAFAGRHAPIVAGAGAGLFFGGAISLFAGPVFGSSYE